ncbi:transposase family protein [Candidatus Protofrankia californiensis]|nr:transposase family protein [Candidatus Protofrankia californiensis]
MFDAGQHGLIFSRCQRWFRSGARDQALLVLAHLRNGDTYEQLTEGFEVG